MRQDKHFWFQYIKKTVLDIPSPVWFLLTLIGVKRWLVNKQLYTIHTSDCTRDHSLPLQFKHYLQTVYFLTHTYFLATITEPLYLYLKRDWSIHCIMSQLRVWVLIFPCEIRCRSKKLDHTRRELYLFPFQEPVISRINMECSIICDTCDH